jgi:hypothetical protein
MLQDSEATGLPEMAEDLFGGPEEILDPGEVSRVLLPSVMFRFSISFGRGLRCRGGSHALISCSALVLCSGPGFIHGYQMHTACNCAVAIVFKGPTPPSFAQ